MFPNYVNLATGFYVEQVPTVSHSKPINMTKSNANSKSIVQLRKFVKNIPWQQFLATTVLQVPHFFLHRNASLLTQEGARNSDPAAAPPLSFSKYFLQEYQNYTCSNPTSPTSMLSGTESQGLALLPNNGCTKIAHHYQQQAPVHYEHFDYM